jgi:hypothetical protein
MPDADSRLLFRRIAAVLNGVYAAFQLATAALFLLVFGGMGTLVLAIGIAEQDLVPQVFGGVFAGAGVVVGLLVLVLMCIPHLVAMVVLWRPGGVWRDILAVVLTMGAWAQFPHGTLVAVATLAVAILELVAHSQKPGSSEPTASA